ncbi:MarR family winged helix-turn-helix transcriptional regulator [Polynucleobacter sphagniphilus]|uniref:MarR family 2-MHQ and catechol resistance regulon transcriptional repressor n=1 Tax=Polynucleobacter sphagniphilus TaxID=1743169 RepID=A0AA43S5Z2_9BURK|nr:MarR family transcriptional regulator [Polynucleobacter sphagniphilus]MDF9788901.1 MarR family 2-MHQ and catechol resistance regulon transcriptional repressor [Polynucleobacter sphagniphilus]MDH6154603.1 MarR family 2-MHQ and catechol resistance regulon transcriptional repressor [Polynucleobacter sphagniphilus]MDH6249966.1 MarR family 2-MHQ and catechol resistance regulon transcriptional repressor [Polynucleobacter sphagniphilus]MDH6302311.1 MarR family 2-MHQ and catechol resistance regulon 
MNFLPTLRDLVIVYQAFERYSAPNIKALGLTMTQFDVIATLGNQPPMTCKELGEKTLVTKGTLTGVLERLELKGVIFREANSGDGRSQLIALTKEGQQLFEKVFPEHLDFLNQAFSKLSNEENVEIQHALKKLNSIF